MIEDKVVLSSLKVKKREQYGRDHEHDTEKESVHSQRGSKEGGGGLERLENCCTL